jgi:hypothetical protein
MRNHPKTRTAKSARRKLALTLLSVLVVLATSAYASNGYGWDEGWWGDWWGHGGGDFDLTASPSKQTVTAGESIGYGLEIDPDKKFDKPVTLTVTGLPPSTSTSFLPNPVPASGTTASLTINTNIGGTTPAGSYPLTIKGAAGSDVETTKVTLTVLPATQPNYSIIATPGTHVISDDDEETYSFAISRAGGFTAPVALSISGLPKGVTGQFVPNPVPGDDTTLELISGSKPKGDTYTLTISGKGFHGPTEIKRSTTISLTVEEKKAFDIDGDVPPGLAPGASLPLNLTLTNPHKFSLRVRSLAVTLDRNTTEPDCGVAENYAVVQVPETRYPITLPGRESMTLDELEVADPDKPKVTMLNLPVNQNACKGATIFLRYNGWATKK